MKKIISLIICFTVISGVFCVPSIADEEKKALYGNEYEMVNTLFDIGAFFDDAESEVSRMQFVKAFLKIFDYTYSDENFKISFTDVKANSEEYFILKNAVWAGIISDASFFRPDDTITLPEALKICSVPAGYMKKAEALGGYPTGYIRIASELHITEGVKTDSDKLNVDNAYKLLYNLLNSKIIEVTSLGTFSTSYGVNENKTVLSALFDIHKTEGIMNSNEYARLGDSGYIGIDNKIEVNGITYKTDNDFNKFLGYNVYLYYKNIENVKTAVFVESYGNETFSLVCDSDCTYENNAIKYYKDKNSERKNEIKLDVSFDYIYNGKAFYGYNNDNFIPKTGKITLVDNNRDSKYDIVCVEDYYYMQIMSVDKVNKIITSKYDSSEKIDLSKENVRYRIYNQEEGGNVALSALNNNAMLAVKVSKDELLYDIIVCTSSVEGEISEIKSSDKELRVNDVLYSVSDEFYKSDFKNIAAGKAYIMSLGVFGEIVHAEDISSDMVYGFLVDVNLSGSFSDKYELKIYKSSGEFEIFEIVKRVTIDGIPYSDYSKIDNVLAPSGKLEAQLIKYASEGNVITKIDTAKITADLLEAQNDSSDNSLRRYDIGTATPSYRQKIFWPGFNINGSLIFKIPNDITDEDGYEIGGSFTDGTSNGTIIPYDISLGGSAGVIVCRTDGANLDFTTSYRANEFVLVDSVTTAVDEKGESKRLLRGWSINGMQSWFIEDDVTITKKGVSSSLCKGDLIRIKERNGVILKISVDYDADKFEICDITSSLINPTAYNVALGYQIGKVYSTDGSYCYLSSETKKNADGSYVYDDMTKLVNVMIPSNIAVYDAKNNEIKPADSSDIKTYLGNGDETSSFMIIIQQNLYSYIGIIYNR